MRAISMAIGLASTVLLARVLGTEGYGVYTFALGWVFILGMPLQMGLPTLVMRQVAIYRGNGDTRHLKGIIRWSFRFVGLGALTIGVIGFGAWIALDTMGRWPTKMLVGIIVPAFVLLCLLGLLSLYRAIISGFENVVLANVPDTFARPLLFLALVAGAAMLLGLNSSTVMTLHVIAAGVATVLSWSMASHCLTAIDVKGAQSPLFETRAWLHSLWPMTLQSGAAMINSRLDIAMLGLITGSASVAVYDVGTKVAGLLMVTQALLNASIAPRIARFYASGDKARVQELMVKACRLSFLPSAALLIVIWLAGPNLISILFSEEFAAAYTVAMIVAVGYLYNTGVGAVVVLLNMSGNERTTAFSLSFSAILNAILNIILIPLYGPNGAAVATVVTTIFIQTFLWNRTIKLVGFRGDLFAPRWQAQRVDAKSE